MNFSNANTSTRPHQQDEIQQHMFRSPPLKHQQSSTAVWNACKLQFVFPFCLAPSHTHPIYASDPAHEIQEIRKTQNKQKYSP